MGDLAVPVEWAAGLKLEQTTGGSRLVTLSGAVVGRLRREADYWEIDWFSGKSLPMAGEFRGASDELAELWAVEEIADLLAMQREAIERELDSG